MKRSVSPYVKSKLLDAKFKRETFRCGGKGGQKQNKTETGVRITCLTTGLSCEGREHRTQLANQRSAFVRLIDRMIEYYEDEERKLREAVATGVTRVRTYNEKRNEAKCDVTGAVFNMKKVLDGDLDGLIKRRLEHSHDC